MRGLAGALPLLALGLPLASTPAASDPIPA